VVHFDITLAQVVSSVKNSEDEGLANPQSSQQNKRTTV
jgi:hypothetical protein